MSVQIVPVESTKIDGINPVTSAALRVVDNVVEDSKSTEVVIFSNLVGLAPKLSNVEAPQRGGISGICATSALFSGSMNWAPAPMMMPSGCGLVPLSALPAV